MLSFLLVPLGREWVNVSASRVNCLTPLPQFFGLVRVTTAG